MKDDEFTKPREAKLPKKQKRERKTRKYKSF